jgi:hypothetical protein
MEEAPVGMPDAKGNLIGGPIHGVIDAKLGPLANNGGPTFTHALLPGSPALNAGDPNAVAGMDGVLLYDQRGAPFGRVVGGRIDIGTVESQPIPPAMFGDYNVDGAVDAVDYVIWRATLGDTQPAASGADGNGNGVVDQADYIVWRSNFGRTLPAVASAAFIETVGEVDQAAVRFSTDWFEESRSDSRVDAAISRVISTQSHRRYLDLLLTIDVRQSNKSHMTLSTAALDAAFDDDFQVMGVTGVETQLIYGLELLT